MDDLIFRQAAIDALWKALYDYEDKTEKQFLESEELNTADWFRHRIFVQNMSDIDRQTILKLPSAQQWIPVEKETPILPNIVLVCDSLGKILFDSYIDGSWTYCPYVVAWMPLPEPYKVD